MEDGKQWEIHIRKEHAMEGKKKRSGACKIKGKKRSVRRRGGEQETMQ